MISLTRYINFFANSYSLPHKDNLSILFDKKQNAQPDYFGSIFKFLEIPSNNCRNISLKAWPVVKPINTTTTKSFVPSIWGRLHEPKENYTGSVTWISFLHSFLSSNMSSIRRLVSISCRITSIHVFFDSPCTFLTCPNLIRSTRQTDASVSLRHTWPSHCSGFLSSSLL